MKIIAAISAFVISAQIFFQCLFGIGGMAFGKINIVPEKTSYPVGTTSIAAVVTNGSFNAGPFMMAYHLSKWDGSEWISVDQHGPGPVPPAGGIVNFRPFANTEMHYSIHYNYDPITAGRYCISAEYGSFEFELT